MTRENVFLEGTTFKNRRFLIELSMNGSTCPTIPVELVESFFCDFNLHWIRGTLDLSKPNS